MTAAERSWFDVDKEGLAKVLERRGKEFIVFELISNCLDTAAKVVTVSLAKDRAAPKAVLVIEDDDPELGIRQCSRCGHPWRYHPIAGTPSYPGRRPARCTGCAAASPCLVQIAGDPVREIDNEARHGL